jgi:hypothetical protein
MLAGEAEMVGGVPVLREDDGGELRHQGVDAGHDFIAAGHGQRAAGAEIVLHVDDEEGLGRVAHGLASGGGHDCPPYGLRDRAQPCRRGPC